MNVGEPLNLLGLARASGDVASTVPGTDLSVRRLAGRHVERTAAAAWLLVLEGRLIIDLPHGDFRILDRGDALHLPAGLELELQSVEGEALLVWRSAATP
ncbi:MAG TPA: hypothetical protein VKB31_00865 [Trueperaceae bacterium]|nr:hypothetical protein [Trueperaceae bacterium]